MTSIGFLGIGVTMFIVNTFIAEGDLTLASILLFFGVVAFGGKVASLKRFEYLSTQKKLRLVGIPMLVASIILITFVIGPALGMYGKAILFISGEVESKVSREFMAVYDQLFSSPLLALIGLIICLGGLVKVVTDTRPADIVANILMIFIPISIWMLTFLKVIPVPEGFDALFDGDFFGISFSYIAFEFMFFGIIILMSGVMFLFQNVRALGV